jgi:peptide-methionine (S)-S-oxide reductase
MPGVIRTCVGYSGGDKKNPTYHDLGDHAETVQVQYDPSAISYSNHLDVFWTNHSPMSRRWSRQYMSAIFYHNEEQKALALKSKYRESAKRNRELFTEIIPFSKFHPAEDYHQKHALQRYPDLFNEYKAIYPDMQDFVASTAVARVNGYLAGYGGCDKLRSEIESLGLSDDGRQRLLSKICSQKTIFPCTGSGCV